VAPPSWLDGAGVVTAALGSTETTAQVHPARFTAALLAAAQARGGTLRLGAVESVGALDGGPGAVAVEGLGHRFQAATAPAPMQPA